MKIPQFLVGNLLIYATDIINSREPDFIIQPDGITRYLERWRQHEGKLYSFKIHRILRSDDDRALHDHPWMNISIILYGRYVEHKILAGSIHTRKEYGPGNVIFRRAKTAHRLEVKDGEYVISMFLTGPRIREWGFLCPNGWVHWKIFTGADQVLRDKNGAQIGVSSRGPGCD